MIIPIFSLLILTNSILSTPINYIKTNNNNEQPLNLITSTSTSTKDIAFNLNQEEIKFNSVNQDLVEFEELEKRSIIVSLIDYSVPLTYPTAGTIFTAGSPAYITWNATLPNSITQSQVAQTATLVLGYKSSTSVGFHLDLDNPLGVNIPLFVQPFRYDFVLPSNLTTRTTYILALMGSSGNDSPQFTIMSINGDLGSDPIVDGLSSSYIPPPTLSTVPVINYSTADATFPTASPSPSVVLSLPLSVTPIIASVSIPVTSTTSTASGSIQSKSPTVAATSNASALSKSWSVVIGLLVLISLL